MAKEFAKAFYNGTQWKKKRQKYIKSKHNLCELCGGIGFIVHHKITLTPSNITDSTITLDDRNLQLVCQSCHNKIDHEHQNEFTCDGNYLPPPL